MKLRRVFIKVLLSLFIILGGYGAEAEEVSVFSEPDEYQYVNYSVSLKPVPIYSYEDNKEYIVLPANRIISRKTEDPSWIIYPSIIDKEREGFSVSSLYIFFIMALYLMKKMVFSSRSGKTY